MGDLIRLIYASAAQVDFPSENLNGLLATSRANNAALGVTGMLLYANGSFFQALEGSEDKVDILYDKIKRDPRHTNFTMIIREPIASRSFGDWTMGHAQVTRQELASIPGLNDFFDGASILTEIDDNRAKKLLRAFSAGRWRQHIAGALRNAG